MGYLLLLQVRFLVFGVIGGDLLCWLTGFGEILTEAVNTDSLCLVYATLSAAKWFRYRYRYR